MPDYRRGALSFLYKVMRGKIQDTNTIIDRERGEAINIPVPVSTEGRMKAAERILKYYTDQDTDSKKECGVVVIADVKELERLEGDNNG